MIWANDAREKLTEKDKDQEREEKEEPKRNEKTSEHIDDTFCQHFVFFASLNQPLPSLFPPSERACTRPAWGPARFPTSFLPLQNTNTTRSLVTANNEHM
jgi:hypothetical protein